MWWLYVVIFFAKLVEVSLSTVRIVLVNRGERVKGALVAFCEIIIWVYVAGNVLQDVASDPIKVLVYATAFALGNFVGVTLENRLAIGTSCLQVVIAWDKKEELTSALRGLGYGVTSLVGEGKNGPVSVLMIYMKRKKVPKATEEIRKHSPDALITVNDVRSLRNGYLLK